MDYSIVHWKEPNSYNVRCRNGSYHVRRMEDKKFVTCGICLGIKPPIYKTFLEWALNLK